MMVVQLAMLLLVRPGAFGDGVMSASRRTAGSARRSASRLFFFTSVALAFFAGLRGGLTELSRAPAEADSAVSSFPATVHVVPPKPAFVERASTSSRHKRNAGTMSMHLNGDGEVLDLQNKDGGARAERSTRGAAGRRETLMSERQAEDEIVGTLKAVASEHEEEEVHLGLY